MEIDFIKELRKRDKLNKLFDFCRNLVPKFPETFWRELASKYPEYPCKGIYTAKGGNYVTARVYPKMRGYCVKVNLNSKMMSSPPSQYENLSAIIDLNREVIFLFCRGGFIMRTPEGKIEEAIGWIDCDSHIPELIPELSQNTRKGFEEAYDIFFAENVPVLELPENSKGALIKALGDATKNAERKKQKSSFKLIKPSDVLLDDEKTDNKIK
jgi:hypothetical protein